MRRRGQVLLICLVFLPIFLILVLLMCSQSVSRMILSWHDQRAQTARFAAESALARTIAELRRNGAFAEAVEVRFADLEALGRVHFDASRPRASLNNRSDGPLALPGSPDMLVYPQQIHLIAVGACRGVEVVTEVRLSQPPFPYVIYASGRFHSSGDLLLGAVKPGVDVHAVQSETDLLPAEMLANSSGADALVLEGQSTVVGSPKAVGGVQLGKQVKVLRGQPRPGERAQDPPTVRIQDYDPAGRTGVQTLAQSSYAVREPMSGLIRYRGPQLTFSQGLELSGGLLYVDGNLEIGAGGVRGQGAILCTGNVTIRGGSDFQKDSQCAVVAGGDLTLTGADRNSAYYQGLLYAGGERGVSVSGVTLLGAAVAGNPRGAGVEVSRSRVIFDAGATRVSEDIGFSSSVYPPGGFQVRGGGWGLKYLRLKPVQGKIPTPAQLVAAGAPPLTPAHFELVDASGNPVDGVQDAFIQWGYRRGEGIDKMNLNLQEIKPDDPLLPGGKLDFDLSRFLKEADRLRLIWRS